LVLLRCPLRQDVSAPDAKSIGHRSRLPGAARSGPRVFVHQIRCRRADLCCERTTSLSSPVSLHTRIEEITGGSRKNVESRLPPDFEFDGRPTWRPLCRALCYVLSRSTPRPARASCCDLRLWSTRCPSLTRNSASGFEHRGALDLARFVHLQFSDYTDYALKFYLRPDIHDKLQQVL
jgi:hypothetical protein